MPPLVPEVSPVPPLATARVPVALAIGMEVRLVATPEEGVPKAPPLTTNAPAVPTLTPRAVATPVPGVRVAREVKRVPPVLVQVILGEERVQSPPRVMAVGAEPAPPPTRIEPEARTPEADMVEAPEK